MVLRDRRPSGALPPPRLLLRVFLALIVLTAAAACGSESGRASRPAASAPATAPPEPPTTVDPHLSWIAEAMVPAVGVFETPDAPEPKLMLPNPGVYGAPLVFLEKDQEGPDDWLHVYVPVRPNGSAGWVRLSDVNVVSTPFRVEVQLGANQLIVWQGDQVFHQEAVAVGTSNTPTPVGLFFVTTFAKSTPEQQRKYGPYVYVLSGYSEVFDTFDGGHGEVGIHGTNNAASLGHDVSHGCIRMSNEGITKLAEVLPLGVPVEIKP